MRVGERLTEVELFGGVVNMNVHSAAFGGSAKVVAAVFNTPDPVVVSTKVEIVVGSAEQGLEMK